MNRCCERKGRRKRKVKVKEELLRRRIGKESADKYQHHLKSQDCISTRKHRFFKSYIIEYISVQMTSSISTGTITTGYVLEDDIVR